MPVQPAFANGDQPLLFGVSGVARPDMRTQPEQRQRQQRKQADRAALPDQESGSNHGERRRQ